MVVSNDAVTAHLGALGGEPGAVIVAGTGAIALAATPAGWARADGWGSMLGDDGGGYWIGRRALAMALREHDGRGGARGAAATPAAGDAARRARATAARGPWRRRELARLRAAAEARFGPLAQIARAVYDAPDPVATVAGVHPRRRRPGPWGRRGRRRDLRAAAAPSSPAR